jgi:Flp pilus assembly protein TadD
MNRWRWRAVLILAVTSVFLYAYPVPNLPYESFVAFHFVLGLVLAALLLPFLAKLWNSSDWLARIGWVLLAAGTTLGIILIKVGTRHRDDDWLYTHIALCSVAVLFLAASWMKAHGWLGASFLSRSARFAGVTVLFAGVAASAWYVRVPVWNREFRIVNPTMPPATMDGEGDGPKGDFFPSSGQTLNGKHIPANYFIQASACQRCHADIYRQWESSAHHFSSFNNQWYRKSIEYMQDTVGIRPSKWCAGCHDPALLYSGMFDKPIREVEDTPAGQAGLSCVMCHSFVHVKNTMGNGNYVLQYPELHRLAASDNPLVRRLHDFMVRLDPEPHRRVFLKPFMRNQIPQFCSACHKVHLDVPVNHYRWERGFNEHDNWQASGVSGYGARSFYYPAHPMMCADCHMPLVRSNDDGNINGYVHSHRFPGANTALPTANHDEKQLETVENFLKDGQISVDIFAISPAGKKPMPVSTGAAPGQELSTTFGVGEEAELNLPKVTFDTLRPVTAPLGRVHASVRCGDDVLVDVVVRTRKVGHFFPGGTVDAFDVWLELKATDEKGNTLFWSGKVEDNGKGPVDPGAHFYRSQQIDEHGNLINKRNAWATRAVAYVHLIPPGAADTVHYRMHIPDYAGNKITLHAELNYRKFMWWNTQFAFDGVEDPAYPGSTTPDYDDRKWTFDGELSHDTGHPKQVPNLPIVTMAEDTKTLDVLPKSVPAPAPQTVMDKEDWMEWNDYGIGLFLQGDLQGAEAAFRKATQADPNNPDGWVNIGRVRVQEGDTEGGIKVLKKALELSPNLARANFFYAHALRQEGKYDQAAALLKSVLEQYPQDRVVRNELGRVYFLEKRYTDAVKQFEYTLTIDPEDLQAHYNLMLCYNGLGDEKLAEEHKVRYLRFKADEAAEAITGPYRQLHPDDNNERQAIHEHVSVPLEAPGKTEKYVAGYAAKHAGNRVKRAGGRNTIKMGGHERLRGRTEQ